MWNLSISGVARSCRPFAIAATLTAGLAACASDAPVAPASRLAPASVADTAPSAVPSNDLVTYPHSFTVPRVAYAYSSVPFNSTGSWKPSILEKYSSSNDSIVVSRVSNGRYVVSLWGLGRPLAGGEPLPVAIVTAHAPASPGMRCTATYRDDTRTSGLNRMVVHVQCKNPVTNILTDSRFWIHVVGAGALPPRLAFAFAGQPTTQTYTPGPAWSYTSGPYGPVTITHHTVFAGDYYVNTGSGSPQGSVHLVNSNSVSDVCKVAEFKSFGPRVRCFDVWNGGQLHNMTFDVLQMSRGVPGRRFGFAWADQYTNPAPYTPNTNYSYNSGQRILVQRLGVGDYAVDFQSLLDQIVGNLWRTPIIQVTSFGTAFSACSVASWDRVVHNEIVPIIQWRRVRVRCTDSIGQPEDSRFSVMVTE
jgi:hypothetical protein